MDEIERILSPFDNKVFQLSRFKISNVMAEYLISNQENIFNTMSTLQMFIDHNIDTDTKTTELRARKALLQYGSYKTGLNGFRTLMNMVEYMTDDMVDAKFMSRKGANSFRIVYYKKSQENQFRKELEE